MDQDAGQSLARDPRAGGEPMVRLGGSGMLLLILLLSTALDLYFFTGHYSSDDCTYFLAGDRLVRDGALPNLSQGAIRLTLAGWNALVIWLFGPQVQIVAASYILFHQFLNALTFVLIKRLSDTRAAALGTYYVATFPLLLVYSGMILPDMPVACGCVLAFICYLSWRGNRESRSVKAWWTLFASGVCVGLAYMAKEAALVLLPFFFAAWLTSIKRSRIVASIVQGAAFACGFFVVLLGEYLTLSHLAGESFFRLGWATESVDSGVRAAVNRYGYEPLGRLGWVGQRLGDDVWPLTLKVAIVASLFAFPFVRQRCWSVLLLPLWIFAFQTWGSMNVRSYTPPTIQARYYITVVPLAVTIFAIVAVQVYDWIRGSLHSSTWRGWTRRVAITVAVVVPLFGLSGPDRLAGKLYKADIVGNVTSALHGTTQLEPRAPIVLSATLANYVRLLPRSGDAPYTAANALDRGDLAELFEGGHFYYVELEPRRLAGERKWLRRSTLDSILRAILSNTINPLGQTPPENLMIYRNVAAPGNARIRYQGGAYELSTHAINAYDQPVSRTWHIVSNLIRRPHASASPPDPGSRTVIAYQVDVRPLDHLEPSASPASAWPASDPQSRPRRLVHDMMPLLAEWEDEDDRSSLKHWGVAGNQERHVFEEADGGWKLRTTLGSSRYVWFWPRRSVPRQQYCLEPMQLYEVVLDIEIDGALRAQLCSEASNSKRPEKILHSTKFWLADSHNLLRFYTDARAIAYWPIFKIYGSGTFKINKFQVVAVD